MDENTINEEVSTEEENDGTHFLYSETEGVIDSSEKGFQPKDMENVEPGVWSVQGIWNSVADVEKREPKVRDYISFGNIGKDDYWSRYMKMKGVPESNPFEGRIIKIFQAGETFHDLIKGVFQAAGIYIFSQDDLNEKGERDWSEIPATKTQLKQFGAFDILVGGKPDLQKALDWLDGDIGFIERFLRKLKISEDNIGKIIEFLGIKRSGMTALQKDKTRKIIKHISEQFPNGLKPMIYEIKSINSMAFWGKKNYLHEAYPHHRHQLFGYLKANHKNPIMLKRVEESGIKVDSIDEGRLLYVSKDDLVMAEFPISIYNETLAESYKNDIDTMSGYILRNEEPPKPSYVIFNKRKTLGFQKNKIKYKVRGCYVINWEVTWSSYFTLMTGFKSDKVKDFEQTLKEEIKIKNEIIKAKVLTKVGVTTK